MSANSGDDLAAPRFVYSFFDKSGSCLYVGCTVKLDRRLASHRRERPWWTSVDRIEVTVHPDYDHGVAAEEALIRSLNPVHNRAFTDHDTPRRSGTQTRQRNAALRRAAEAS